MTLPFPSLPLLPKKLRKLLTAFFLQQRSRQQRSKLGQQLAGPAKLLAWPPARSTEELTQIWARLQWFLPASCRLDEVVIAAQPGVDTRLPPASGTITIARSGRPILPVRVVIEREDQQAALRTSNAVLVWKTSALLHREVVRDLTRTFLVDPEWYSLVEQLEWTELYRALSDPALAQQEQEIARENLLRLQALAATRRSLNVCGNGPSMQHAIDQIGPDDFNIVCNTAVQSQSMMDRLRPAVVCFANAVFFGPSAFAKQLLDRAAECVERYGSVVVTPGGYAQHLIGTNYPGLRPHLLGLDFQDDLAIPETYALRTGNSSNVATALMVPLAAALQQNTMHVYGCDGGDLKDRGRWSPWQYFAGAEPERTGAASAHPAFFRDRIVTERYFHTYYKDHCRHFETLLEMIEDRGMRVIAETPSRIPALQSRYRATAPGDSPG